MDKLSLQNKLLELKYSMVPQSVEFTMCHHAKVSILEWAYNNGEIKTPTQIENKIKLLEEELLGAELINAHDLDKQIINSKITQLKEIV